MLAESELIRKESDDAGPSTELEYWKARMAKFNRYDLVCCVAVSFFRFFRVIICSITDQMKSKEVKSVLYVLKAAKSRVMKKWKELDIRVTDAANEAKVLCLPHATVVVIALVVPVVICFVFVIVVV